MRYLHFIINQKVSTLTYKNSPANKIKSIDKSCVLWSTMLRINWPFHLSGQSPSYRVRSTNLSSVVLCWCSFKYGEIWWCWVRIPVTRGQHHWTAVHAITRWSFQWKSKKTNWRRKLLSTWRKLRSFLR